MHLKTSRPTGSFKYIGPAVIEQDEMKFLRTKLALFAAGSGNELGVGGKFLSGGGTG